MVSTLSSRGTLGWSSGGMCDIRPRAWDSATSTTLLERIEHNHPNAKHITVIFNKARYNRSETVNAYLKTPRIRLHFLSAYTPYS